MNIYRFATHFSLFEGSLLNTATTCICGVYGTSHGNDMVSQKVRELDFQIAVEGTIEMVGVRPGSNVTINITACAVGLCRSGRDGSSGPKQMDL